MAINHPHKRFFSRKNPDFEVVNSEKTAEMRIYDEIGFWGITAKDFSEALGKVTSDELHLRINSPGGEVFDGFAIYNALRRFSGRVVVHVDGLAASIASVIAMAGEEIVMADNAYIMIHDPSTIVWGNAEDMRKTADVLDKLQVSIADAYAQRTGITAKELAAMMREETWMTAAEAIDKGFADAKEKTEEKTSVKNFDLSIFAHAPSMLLAHNENRLPTKRELEQILMQDAGMTRAAARAVLGGGYNAINGTQDAADDEAMKRLSESLRAAISTLK